MRPNTRSGRARAGLGAAAAGLLLSAGALAGAQTGGPDQPVPTSPRAGGASPTESVFVPITPCRIVNTQNPAGRFAVGETRGYTMSGNTAGQGGAAACGIPSSAVGLEISASAVLPLDDGYLRFWPAGQAEPTATFLNYQRGENTTNAGTVAVRPGALSNLQVRAFRAPTHVIIDVLGYHVTEAFAVVNVDGSVDRGNGVVSSIRVDEGAYEVRFDRNVTGCAFLPVVANPGAGGTDPRTIGAALRSGTTDGVFVVVRNLAGAATDDPFHLALDC